MKGPTNTGMSRRRNATIAKKTNRREGPDMRLRPLPNPERSMFDQSMLPQSRPPSPPRPRSRIRSQRIAQTFARSAAHFGPDTRLLAEGPGANYLDPSPSPASYVKHAGEPMHLHLLP